MKKKPKSPRSLWGPWLFLLFVAASVVWVRTSTVKATYQYVQHEGELRGVEQEIRKLRVKWLKMTSPRKLEAMAPALGLVAPTKNQSRRYVR